jgi:hypothetical protein
MKQAKLLSTLPLIVLAVLLSVRNSDAAASSKALPNQRSPVRQKQRDTADRQAKSMVPLEIYQATQSALLEALHTIRAQQETAATQNSPRYEPWYAPAVLAQFGLIVIGIFYTIYAWKQWTVIREQADIADRALHVDRPILVPDNFSFSSKRWSRLPK